MSILFTVVLLFTQHSWADVDCNVSNERFSRVQAVNLKACQQHEDFAHLVSQADDWSLKPDKFELYIGGPANELDDNFEYRGIIRIYPASSEETNTAVWLHEYGHAVCSKALYDKLPDHDLFVEKSKIFYNVVESETLKVNARQEELRQIVANVPNPSSTEKIKLQQEYMLNSRAKRESTARVLRAKRGLKQFSTLLSPYSELCADVFAVLFLQDNTAIENAFLKSNTSIKVFTRLDIDKRNFSKNHVLTDVPLNFSTIKSYHNVLAPVRTRLGALGVGEAISTDDKSRFWEKFTNILAKSIAETRSDNAGRSPLQLNLRFLKNLEDFNK